MPPGHPCAHQQRVALGRLAHEPFLVLQDGDVPGYFAQSTERLCRMAGFEPEVVLCVGELVSLTGLVAAGLGVCLVPSPIARIAGDRIVLRPLEEAVAPLELLLVRHRDAHSPALRHLLDMVAAHHSLGRDG
jgi:DNA-binding transcriptional LysR family regulator